MKAIVTNLGYTLEEVTLDNTDLIKDWLYLPARLHGDIKAFIRPLNDDVELIFNPKTNKYFNHGACIRWVLRDNGTQKVVGRIAAFFDRKIINSGNPQPTGACGFFEAENNQEIANTLFDAAKAWLAGHDLKAMDGPVNFGDRDKWWGVLIDGFDQQPTYCMPYNQAYYLQLFEGYGFNVYFTQLTYGRVVTAPLNPLIKEKSDRIARNPQYTFRHLDNNHLEQYTEDFRTVYNLAWSKHQGVEAMSSIQAKMVMRKLAPLLDPDIIWFGYYDETPVAFFIMLPQINQYVKHVNGKMNWYGKVVFFLMKTLKLNRKMFGVAFGVTPDHQNKGLEGAMVQAAANVVQTNGRYDEFEMNWIGSFNPKMIKVAEGTGSDIIKRHATMRYIFDRSIPPQTCPEIK